MKKNEHSNLFNPDNTTKTNLSDGIQGEISNGMNIYFRGVFKPVATIMKAQQTIDKFGNLVKIKGKAHHNPCVVPRSAPIVEILGAIVLIDFQFLDSTKNNKPFLV